MEVDWAEADKLDPKAEWCPDLPAVRAELAQYLLPPLAWLVTDHLTPPSLAVEAELVPEGKTREQWQEEVRERTGRRPSRDLYAEDSGTDEELEQEWYDWEYRHESLRQEQVVKSHLVACPFCANHLHLVGYPKYLLGWEDVHIWEYQPNVRSFTFITPTAEINAIARDSVRDFAIAVGRDPDSLLAKCVVKHP